jgi:hypothetical protein
MLPLSSRSPNSLSLFPQIWIWCSLDASRDSISKELKIYQKHDNEIEKSENFQRSLLSKLGLTRECLEWLKGRVYIGGK